MPRFATGTHIDREPDAPSTTRASLLHCEVRTPASPFNPFSPLAPLRERATLHSPRLRALPKLGTPLYKRSRLSLTFAPILFAALVVIVAPAAHHLSVALALLLVLSVSCLLSTPYFMVRRSAKPSRRKDTVRTRAEKRQMGSRARSANLLPTAEPLTTPRTLADLREAVLHGHAPHPRGLLNLGNTCYFNAVMQNLGRVAVFRNYFLGDRPAPGEGAFTNALRAFYAAMWDLNEDNAINPSYLLDQVVAVNHSFVGRSQHDAHELMRTVFDAVVEEEKKRLAAPIARLELTPDADLSDNASEQSQPSTPPTDESVETDEKLPAEVISHAQTPITLEYEPNALDPVGNDGVSTTEVEPIALPLDIPADIPSHSEAKPTPLDSIEEDSEHADEPPAPKKLVTIVENTFCGALSSTIRCTECGSKSSVREPFFDLQLPLVPRQEDEVVAKENTNSATSKRDRKTSPNPTNQADCTVFIGPMCNPNAEEIPTPSTAPPPAPPPPPPPLPPSVVIGPVERPSSSDSTESPCDIFSELRSRSDLRERAESSSESASASACLERSVVIYEGYSAVPPEPPNGDTASAFGDDEEEDENGFTPPSLFDTDTEDNQSDSGLQDVSGLTAYSTSEAAQSQNRCSTTVKKSGSTASRRGSLFSSFLSGFGSSSAAPHGFHSVSRSLAEFTKVEVLEGENAYRCEECTRREAVRIALQRRKKEGCRNIAKENVPTAGSPVSMDENRAEGVSEDVSELQGLCERVGSEGKDGTVSVERVLSTSPVTSSESSSGVSSEDDGEMVIEEELEKCEQAQSLTREQEDGLVKELNVKIPTVWTKAEKRLLIQKAPEVLAVQLKRFTQIGLGGPLRKMAGHVEFDTELDLTDYVDESEENAKEDGFSYVLTGIAVHNGSLSGGHYVSYVREGVESPHRGGWFLCNDSRISPAEEKDVLDSEAYILFYERLCS